MKRYLESADHPKSSPDDSCVLIDGSPSMLMEDYAPSRLSAATAAVNEYLDVKVKAYPDDRVAIVSFNDKATVMSDLKSVKEDEASLRRSLRKIETNWCTNITAGLGKAGEILHARPDVTQDAVSKVRSWIGRFLYEEPAGANLTRVTTRNRTRRILLLTDGAHNSGAKPQRLADRLKSLGIWIDVVGIGAGPDAEEFDESLMRRLASRTPDGSVRYWWIGDRASLISKFKELSHHISRISE